MHFGDKVLFRLSSQVVSADKNLKTVSWTEINTARHFYLSLNKLSFNETFNFSAAVLRTLIRFYILTLRFSYFFYVRLLSNFLMEGVQRRP